MSVNVRFPQFPAFQPAARLDGVVESATLRLNAMVQALKAKGLDVVNLTAGEPDAFVPEVVKEAAIRAVRENRSKYTPVAGIPELRDLIAKKTNADQPELEKASAARPWTRDDVIVTNGAKQAIYQVLQAVISAGDEVIFGSPYWLSYPEMVRLAQGRHVVINTPISAEYKIEPEQLRAAITERTRMLILNSPSNPTGAVYSRSELRALGDVLLNHPLGKNIWVVSDEIYDKLVFSPAGFTSFLSAVPEWRDRTVTINGLSKSAALTGWRVGWSVAPRALTQSIATLQGQATSGINSVAQWASLAALSLPESHFAEQLNLYRRRRDLAVKSFQNLLKSRKIEMMSPQGAFYLWVEVGGILRAKGMSDSVQLAEWILEESRVAVVPGGSFGRSDSLRLSFALDEKLLTEGCDRMVAALSS